MGNLFGKLKCGSSKRSARDGSMFRYDPSSYSQNFDDGRKDNNVEVSVSEGSLRFPGPRSNNLPEK